MNKWMPIDKNILKTVSFIIPSPNEGQKTRLLSICKKLSKTSINENNELMVLKKAIEECRGSYEDPTSVFISKMIAIPQENINEHGLSK
jgi:translation elongation factor EF-G